MSPNVIEFPSQEPVSAQAYRNAIQEWNNLNVIEAKMRENWRLLKQLRREAEAEMKRLARFEDAE